MNPKTIISILFAIALAGCKHTHTDDHGHEHDEVKILITAYSNDFEVFAESDPFVQGKTAQILAHFTHLPSFKPMAEGTVTISLATGNKGIRQTAEAPFKPGIYRFQLQPETIGTSRVFFDILYQEKSYRIDGGIIEVFADEHDAIHAAERNQTEHPAAISFTKEQSWVVDFETALAQFRSIGEVIKTVGEVLPAQGEEIILNAQTRGIVRFINNALYEGTELQSGEILLNISGEGLAEGNATQRYQEARNNLERAKADYERLEILAKDRIVSETELLRARNDFENAKSVFDNLSRNFSERGQQVKSPINGYLSTVFVKNGEFVETGQPLAAVSRNNILVIKTEVQQRYAHTLHQLADAHIKLSSGEILSLNQLNGKILSYARNVSSQSHLLPVHLQISNHPGIISGTLLDVYLKTSDSQARITVPNTALIEEQGNYFVFVQIHPESFEKREIKTGQTDGKHTEIVRGLSENERIVSRGALLVKMAAASGAIDPHSGHVH
jgi:membrane fusion protein, heavy metal efflux system